MTVDSRIYCGPSWDQATLGGPRHHVPMLCR